MCGGKKGGIRRGRKGGERREKARKRAKAIPGQFQLPSMPSISWLPRVASTVGNICPSFTFPSVLFFPPISAFGWLHLCCPPLSQLLAELEKGQEVPRKRWEIEFSHYPSPARAGLRSTGAGDQMLPTRQAWAKVFATSYCPLQPFFSSIQPFPLKSRILAHLRIIGTHTHMNPCACTHEEKSRKADIPACL